MLGKTQLALAITVLALAAPDALAVRSVDRPAGAVSATGTVTFTGSATSVRCPLTLSLSLLTGPITLVHSEELGTVTSATIGSCEGGAVAGLLELPWSVTVNDSLPTLSSLTTTNATGLLMTFEFARIGFSRFGDFVNCLWIGAPGLLAPLTHTAAGSSTYTWRSLVLLTGVDLSLASGGVGCPFNMHMAGTLTLSATQTITLS